MVKEIGAMSVLTTSLLILSEQGIPESL